MGIWKEQASGRNESSTESRIPAAVQDEITASPASISTWSADPKQRDGRPKEREAKESVIAADLAIEGKIEGAGHVRLMGKFKGDVNVQGNLTIEENAKLTGSVHAETVVIAGELEGNIEAATSVELRPTGVLNGDLKAGSLTVAAGSRMRGAADFGWEGDPRREMKKNGAGRASS